MGQSDPKMPATVVTDHGQPADVPLATSGIYCLLDGRVGAKGSFEARMRTLKSIANEVMLTTLTDELEQPLTQTQEHEGNASQGFALSKRSLES